MLHISNLFRDKLNATLKKPEYNVATHPTIYSHTYGLKKILSYFIYQYVKRINV